MSITLLSPVPLLTSKDLSQSEVGREGWGEPSSGMGGCGEEGWDGAGLV